MSDSTQPPASGPVALPTAGAQPTTSPATRATVALRTAGDENTDQLGQPEEGGDVESAGPFATYDPQRDREGAAKQLAIIFACILAGGLVLHYVALIGLYVFGFPDGAKELNTVFNIWLPVVSSLVSAIATYYFTRPKN